jgi:hypothetical protein
MPRNVQPFYHRATVLFTATEDIPQKKLRDILRRALKAQKISIIFVDTVDVEECAAEPGGPAALV